MMDPIRRTILTTGAAATAMAAAPRVFAQQGPEEPPWAFSKKTTIRIHFEEAGSGFPIVADRRRRIELDGCRDYQQAPVRRSIRSRSSRANTAASPPICATPMPGSPPDRLEIDRPWDSHTDDHLALMDHLGINKFMVHGFCIGGPLIWNLLKRAPDRSSPPCWRSRAARAPKRATCSTTTI